ncbi:hypothetical protein J6590_034912 [Homalodisca vitripennis]|nr:hypothetical protein J6590_034912 [Homalodisca vitripennis]
MFTNIRHRLSAVRLSHEELGWLQNLPGYQDISEASKRLRTFGTGYQPCDCHEELGWLQNLPGYQDISEASKQL